MYSMQCTVHQSHPVNMRLVEYVLVGNWVQCCNVCGLLHTYCGMCFVFKVCILCSKSALHILSVNDVILWISCVLFMSFLPPTHTHTYRLVYSCMSCEHVLVNVMSQTSNVVTSTLFIKKHAHACCSVHRITDWVHNADWVSWVLSSWLYYYSGCSWSPSIPLSLIQL